MTPTPVNGSGPTGPASAAPRIKAARSFDTDQRRWSDSARAAAPATSGEENEVPSPIA